MKTTNRIYLLKKALSLILFLFFASFAYCTTNHNAISRAIDTTEIVHISQTKQVIRLKGSNDQNPVLLYLNGGPGDSVLDLMDKAFSELQKDFIVVLWDQRNVGKTSELKNQKIPITQELFENDTYELIQYLLQRFSKKKIVLVAHSYGTTLGFGMARNHPELLFTFVAANPLINQTESELITLNMLKEHAKKSNNKKAIKQLNNVSIPFKNGEEPYYARKWLFDFEGKVIQKDKSFRRIVLAWSASWLELFNEVIQENLFESTKKIDCPIYFIIGQNDYQTNSVLTQKYYHKLQAPQKEIYSIKNAGHHIPFENGMDFQNAVKEHVLSTIANNKN